jgi:hypothetical protein
MEANSVFFCLLERNANRRSSQPCVDFKKEADNSIKLEDGNVTFYNEAVSPADEKEENSLDLGD